MSGSPERPRPRGQGFDHDQTRAWAKTYIAEFGSGAVDRFLAWIDAEQQR